MTHGISDFRGVEPGGADDPGRRRPPLGKRAYLGGICEFGASQGLTDHRGRRRLRVPPARRRRSDSRSRTRSATQPIGQHLFGLLMQGEDAPRRTNRVDLDPTVRDVFGLPVPRVTYENHPFETGGAHLLRPGA